MKTTTTALTIAILILVLPMVILAQPSIIINPSSGAPETAITIEGKGFKADEEIDIILTLGEGEKIGLGTEKIDVIKADASGAFCIKSAIPKMAKSGTYKIEVIGSKGTHVEGKIEVTIKDKK